MDDIVIEIKRFEKERKTYKKKMSFNFILIQKRKNIRVGSEINKLQDNINQMKRN